MENQELVDKLIGLRAELAQIENTIFKEAGEWERDGFYVGRTMDYINAAKEEFKELIEMVRKNQH